MTCKLPLFCSVADGSSLIPPISTGIPLSTYFSAIKLRWMIDHHKEVHDAHESDDLMFGTVDTWLVYVSCDTTYVLNAQGRQRLTSPLRH